MTGTELSARHRRHIADIRARRAAVDHQGLRLGDQYVMFFAEADLMRLHAIALTDGVPRPDVLEVGLGLGVFAEQLHRFPVGSFTAVEPHRDAAQIAQARVLPASLAWSVITEPWQVVDLPDRSYDAIMLDTWPPEGRADSDFADFVATVATRCLRPGGRFSFFHSGAQMSEARASVLSRHFAHWRSMPYRMPERLTPRDWTKPSRDFLVPVATKGTR